MLDVFKKIGKHTLIYSLANILARMIGFFMIPVYTRYLTPSDYGIIELLDLTNYVIGMVVGVGISQAIQRFYYEYNDRSHRDQVVSTAFIVAILIQLFVFTLLFFFRDPISLLVFKTDQYSPYIQVMSGTLCFGIMNELALSYIRAKQQSIRYALFSLVRLILGLSLNIYLIAFLQWEIWGVLYSGLISGGVMTAVLGATTLFEVKIHFSLEKLKEMLKYGIPLIPASAGMFVLTFSDRFFLQRYAPLQTVGIYSLGYKLGMVMSVLITSPFLLYWGVSAYEISKMENAKELFGRIQLYFTFVLILGSLGLSMVAENLVKLLSPPEFSEAARIIPIVALSYVFLGLNYFFHAGIHIEKKTKYLAFVLGGSAVLNLVLNYLLIPRYQAMGAAWATLLSFAIMAAGNYFFSQRLYPIEYEYSRMLKMMTIGTAIYGLSGIVPAGSDVYEIILKMVLLISFPLVLLVVNFYNSEEKELALKLISHIGAKTGIGKLYMRGR